MATLVSLVKELKQEANTFKNNVAEVKDIFAEIGETTTEKINEGVQYITDFPKILGKQLLKLLKLLADVFASVIGEGLFLFLKLLYKIFQEVYMILEKTIPGFYLLKYILLVFLIMQVHPTISVLMNLSSVIVGRKIAFLLIYGGISGIFLYTYSNFEEVMKMIYNYVGDVEWTKIIKKAIENLGPEILKITEKVATGMAKVFG